jgi:hypothetical protein
VKTDELIDLLSSDHLFPRPIWSSLAMGTAVGTLAAATLFFSEIGFRPDIAEAVHNARFLFKFVVTMSLAATAVLVTLKSSRPDDDLRSSRALILAPSSWRVRSALNSQSFRAGNG